MEDNDVNRRFMTTTTVPATGGGPKPGNRIAREVNSELLLHKYGVENFYISSESQVDTNITNGHTAEPAYSYIVFNRFLAIVELM